MSDNVLVGSETIVIGMHPGDLLLESIREAIAQYAVHSGVIVSGIGTLKSCRMHYVNHTEFPPEDKFFEIREPLELSSVSGVIADGIPHPHIVVSCREDKVWGGHLEEGSEVLYLGEVVILKFSSPVLTRRPDQHGIKQLGAV